MSNTNGHRFYSELTADERAAGHAVYKSVMGKEIDPELGPDRAWVEGWIAGKENLKQSEPSIWLKWDKAGDSDYTATMTVRGLSSEKHAKAAVVHMQRLFCGQEQEARHDA